METRRSNPGPPLPERASDAPGWPVSAPDSATPRSGSHADDPTIVSDSTPRGGDDVGIEITKSLIQGYELHEEIHRGGQGVVYRATQISTKRRVALKVLLEGPFASQSARLRFEREIELAASLQHPNIVTILDSGVSAGRYYFAMEFIDGERLHNYLDAVKPDMTDTLKLFARICAAVNFAHQRGVIHRDIKPSNILVTSDGQPHVLDFGLAKASGMPEPTQTTVAVLSTSGQMLGTLAYMSPEQAAGDVNVDVRSDVYSLGVLFYEGLLGQPPYDTNAPLGEILRRIAEDEPLAPRQLRARSRYHAELDDEIETILLKSLEKDPNRRYQTAGDLGSDIMRYLAGEPIEAKRASGLYMLKKTVRRYRWQAITALSLLGMLVVFLILFATLYSRESFYREKAEQAQKQEEQARNAALTEKQAAIEARGEAERNEREAERSARDARESAEKLRRALAHQKVQSGQIAIARGDYSAAREHFWNAFDDDPGDPTALWALRQYYMDTGDAGSLRLPGDAGPTAVSADVTRAAVPSMSGVALHDLETGRMKTWYAAPSAPTAITIAGDGVLAGGPGWVRGWKPDHVVPDFIANFALYSKPDYVAGAINKSVFALAERDLMCWRSGTLTSARLAEGGARNPLYLASSDLLVFVMEGAVWTARESGGRMVIKRSPSPNKATVTALCADGPDSVAVAAGTTVFSFSPTEPADSAWTEVAQLVPAAISLDANREDGALLVADAEGTVTQYLDGCVVETWRVDDRPLLAARLTGNRQILTIDADRVVTRWRRPDEEDARTAISNEPALSWTVSRNSMAGLLMGQ
ncbi:MAG: protein kinase, partial [Phycisphaerales bacterium]|nr:protein kinase [Phycisphaerales bacterium]